MMALDSCSDLCGWISTFVAFVAGGTTSVPIKSKAATSVDIDPLAFETYKRLTYFVLSFSVLLMGEEITFTPWGIVSGFMLVPGGVAAVYAVKNAGLAVSQGTWSSLKVLVSFAWGLFIFDEDVASRGGAFFAIVLMVIGIWGMSFYSAPDIQPNPDSSFPGVISVEGCLEEATSPYALLLTEERHEDEDKTEKADETSKSDIVSEPGRAERATTNSQQSSIGVNETGFSRCFKKLSQRQIGLFCAVFDGLWGGSKKGLSYVISESSGALMVVLLLWALRYFYNLCHSRSLVGAFRALPSLHIQAMWLPGITAGSLSTATNIGSILSVSSSLGYSVGYPVAHASLIVSGLFGIFRFNEVRGAPNISGWFLAALVALIGILFLCHEHET